MTKNDRDGKMFPTSTSEEETCQNNGGTAPFVLVRFFVFVVWHNRHDVIVTERAELAESSNFQLLNFKLALGIPPIAVVSEV